MGLGYITDCTADRPWDRVDRKEESVRHHNTREVGDQSDGWPGGDIVTIECVNCGTRWREELPQ